MNDEFVICKVISTGSEDNAQVEYNLDFNKHQYSIENISLDEIKRLSTFLNGYLSNQEGGAE
ncbi:hypothetical protein [Bacteroides timonensis]|uniref:hypothetical protein n=1 Tax=Bacteroides timonensis TaxID=1470345 RepID=UPI0004B9EA48|nr:hypothetical protein [Bacteroides timonensis]